MGEALAGPQLPMVLALARVAWLSVDLASLEMIREICIHTLVVCEQKRHSIEMIL